MHVAIYCAVWFFVIFTPGGGRSKDVYDEIIEPTLEVVYCEMCCEVPVDPATGLRVPGAQEECWLVAGSDPRCQI